MKEFETKSFKLIIHENLLKEFIVKKGVTLHEKDIWESRDISIGYKPGIKLYVIMEGEEDTQVSPDARRAAASEENSKYTAALALCSPSVYQAIAGNLFLKINKPKVPTRFFDSRDKALAWLKMLMNR